MFCILLFVVVNLTLIDLPGLTKVAVGVLSFHSFFSNIQGFLIMKFLFPIRKLKS